MTEANDLDAARVEFMDCAVEAAAGKGGKDEALEAREVLQTNGCNISNTMDMDIPRDIPLLMRLKRIFTLGMTS